MKQCDVHVDATDAVPAYPKFANTIAHALAVVKLFYKHLPAVTSFELLNEGLYGPSILVL